MSEKLLKTAKIGENAVSEADLAKINQYALEPLKAEEVFTFKVMAGDNGLDDRNFEPFSAKALKDMAARYKGKPMIWDHGWGAKGTEQVARIYDSEVIETEKVLDSGEKETQLVLKAYMPLIESNESLIKEIKAGIKKEVSTSVRAEKLTCSICGQDQMKDYCRHWAGRDYDGQKCLMTIDGVKDVFELSFVGTPASPRAGTIKAYNPDKAEVKETDFKDEKLKDIQAPDISLMERELFLMAESARGDDYE